MSSSGANGGAFLSFDDLNRLRILQPEYFNQTQELAEDSQGFTEKITDFSTTVQEILKLLQLEGEKIEHQKMRAIGERNRLETETEWRKKKSSEISYEIKQKQSETNRLQEYYDSLMRLEQEQRNMIEKLNK